MKICLLTKPEVARLENHKIEPLCTSHRHIPLHEALAGIVNDILRVVQDEGRLRSVTEPDSNVYRWRNRMSGGVKTRQLVPLT